MESSSSSTAVLASAILYDFYNKNAYSDEQHVLLQSCKTLCVLIKNASTKQDAKYKTIKLSNKTIQRHVVQVPDALDVLACAGFVNDNKQDCLVFAPVDDSHEMATCMVGLLQVKIQELQLQVPTAMDTTTTTKPRKQQQKDNPFLSEEERKERLKKAKAARKTQEAARKAERLRWQEDQQERLEAAKRREAQFAAITAIAPPAAPTQNDIATGVSLKELAATRRMRKNEPIAESHDIDMQEVEEVAQKKTAHVQVDAASNETKQEHHHQRPLPNMPMDSSDKVADELWKSLTANVSTCSPVNGIRDSSFFKATMDSSSGTCLKRLFAEMKQLPDSLPKDRLASIWIRWDEETPQYIRALIAAPLNTPYGGGLFCFDVYVPNDYPQVPPKVILLTTGGGRVRFGPNLYANGKVCLSLLGTWPGPKWSPSHSNLYQILVSIQALILGAEQPYYLEPGHGGWEGEKKDGQYVSHGQTLTGKKVTGEFGVPPHLQAYNDVLRVGTVRFAMLETLQSSSGSLARHLEAFAVPIQIHFYCNRSAILQQVQQWTMTASASKMDIDDDEGPFVGRFNAAPPGNLKDLVPKLEQRLSSLASPPIDGKDGDMKMAASKKRNSTHVDVQLDTEVAATGPAESLEAKAASTSNEQHGAHDGDGDQKMAAIPDHALKKAPVEKVISEPDDMQVDAAAEAPASDAASLLKAKMQEAANAKDFKLAGHYQEQLKQLEDLENRMNEAATEGNFIRAGRLQEQIEALSKANVSDQAGPTSYSYDESAQIEQFNDDDTPIGMPGSMGNVGGLAVGTNVFVPPGHPSSYTGSQHHDWGMGSTLNSSTTKATTAPTAAGMATSSEATLPNVVIRKAPPPESVCRLRFRLPHSATHTEDFDRNSPLSKVYSCLEAVMSTNQPQPGQSQETTPFESGAPQQAHNVAPPLRTSGAWAQPQSSAGFTLLMSLPKREFNLEMHGTKTLSELGLAPSATLTVMKCSDRGLARRGEVESRLAQASGGAMDVDGLSYEALQELTERVGAAKPTAITEEVLNRNSTLLSPSEMETDDDVRCPVCLGDYDRTNTNKTLRKLHRCGHLMHAACLATWLDTKSSCPVCKSDIAEE